MRYLAFVLLFAGCKTVPQPESLSDGKGYEQLYRLYRDVELEQSLNAP